MNLYDLREIGKIIHNENEITKMLVGNTLVWSSEGYTTFTVGVKNDNNILNICNLSMKNGTIPGFVEEIYINDISQAIPIKEANEMVTYTVNDGDRIKIKGHFSLRDSRITEILNFTTRDDSLTSTRDMFINCVTLKTLDVSNLNTTNITDMDSMFHACPNLTSLNLSNFDTSKVTDMNDMFYSCAGLTSLDLSSFDTSNVTNMRSMFSYCDRLTNLDLSNFDTSKVTNMNNMFSYCRKLETLTFTDKFMVLKVADASYMFYYCEKLTSLDLSSLYFATIEDKNEEWTNMLGKVNPRCKIYVAKDFPKTPSQLGWTGTFIRK